MSSYIKSVLIVCKECRSDLPDGSIYCGVCGERLPKDAQFIYSRYKDKPPQSRKHIGVLYPRDGSEFDWVEKEQTILLKISIYILMLSTVILVIISLTYLFQSLFLFVLYLLLGILQYGSSVALSSFYPISRHGVVVSTLPIIIISLFNLPLLFVVTIFYGVIYYTLFIDPETILIFSSKNYMRPVPKTTQRDKLSRDGKRLLVEKYFGDEAETFSGEHRDLLEEEKLKRDSIYSKMYQVKDE